jgi:hypothetical protein
MVKVQLPPGCKGLDCKDGTRYTASKPGGYVTVSDRHAGAIESGQFGETGLIDASGTQAFGTQKGRKCPSCKWLWNTWTKVCHRCGEETFKV